MPRWPRTGIEAVAWTASQLKGHNTMSNQPTHRIFGVSKPQGAQKAVWREIGAAWPHRNGGGFSLKFKSQLTAGEEIALRVVTPRKALASTFEGEVA
jgi:hypothetical protein